MFLTAAIPAVWLAVNFWPITLGLLGVGALVLVMHRGGRISQAPAEDALAKARAEKRERRLQDVWDWDHEWFRLQNPGRSSRERDAIVDDYHSGRL